MRPNHPLFAGEVSADCCPSDCLVGEAQESQLFFVGVASVLVSAAAPSACGGVSLAFPKPKSPFFLGDAGGGYERRPPSGCCSEPSTAGGCAPESASGCFVGDCVGFFLVFWWSAPMLPP